MLDFDSLREIGSTIGKNKMRTALTGLAVAWGIFILICLLAFANGFNNGMKANFSGRATNSISLWPGWTSMPYKGMPTNRNIRFDERDYELIRTRIPEVEYVSPRIFRSANITYGEEYGSWRLNGVSDDAQHISIIKVRSGDGRFLNKLDLKERRKVMVISPEIKRVLFKNENPLGKYVVADGIAFQVIGVFDDSDSPSSNAPVYIPFTTAQMLYSGGYGFGQIEFTINGVEGEEANNLFIERLRRMMGELHTFNPEDRSALYVWNRAERAAETNSILNGITLVIWVIGIASLMAGVVGIGNIMLITVKERTREIGIRKALGATPASILNLIILEAIIITTVAGYLGVVVGVGVTEMVSPILESVMNKGGGDPNGFNPKVIEDATVDIGIVIKATIVLIVSGVGAGLIPAINATKISPIEAMRAD